MTEDRATQVFAVSADGTEISVTDVGAGPPIIVVHGAGDSAGSWSSVASQLADEFRVICIERRLYGRSGRPRSAHSIDREADDVVCVMEAIGAPTIVVGHSAGRWWPSRRRGGGLRC